MSLACRQLNADKVRIPELHAGEATVINRYGKERAVLIHPDDFHRLEELDRTLTEISLLEPLEPSPEARRAHQEEGTPGTPITDPAIIGELFG